MAADRGSTGTCVALLVLAFGSAACRAPADTSDTEVPFVERAGEVGLDFTHRNGMSGALYFVEIFGAGAALFDYDGDGDLDAYLVQGGPLGPDRAPAGEPSPSGPLQLSDRLYRNELSERGELFFTDVTAASGIRATAYGMGVAAGDHDRDGRVDLFVTAFGSSTLWRNNGDGTFGDVTRRSGAGDDRWSTSAAFLDYDRDGWLDLFVTRYVHFAFAGHRPCATSTGTPEYCGPERYTPLPDRLLRNRGDGTFEDRTVEAGLARHYGPGLGVIAADLDGDGWVDLYVANDGTANQLWINRGDGTFEERAVLAGCAYDGDGKPEAGMGVDAGDYDGDGDDDLFLTHLDDETHTLYANDGRASFVDRTVEAGLAAPSRGFTGFGTAFLDYDNDGRLDLFVANGAVKRLEALARSGDPFPLRQRNQLFRNEGGGRFSDRSAEAGAAFALSEVSRGAAFGDVDNDGDTDVLVTNNNGPARLLINRVGAGRSWIGLRLADPAGRLDEVGAVVELILEDGSVLRRIARTAASYLSSSDPRVLCGLGDGRARELRVRWPDGSRESWPPPPTGRYTTVRRGSGRRLP